MSTRLYVGNLPYEVSDTDLQDLFGQVGPVASVTVMRDRETGRARGFAFVEMASEGDVQGAIDRLNQQSFGGRTLTVNEARPQAERSGGFGGAPRRRSEPRW
jgi:cold-inducible RNA-binding protein